MEKTCKYDICTGCQACAGVCPKNCIDFFDGEGGQLLPLIDQNKCIDCNRCRQVCPALRDYEFTYPRNAYAAINTNREDYLTSTSGGAGQALAKLTIDKGGVVYGCASLPGARVEHIRVEDVEHLRLLQGSKYVQSKTISILKSLINDVKQGKPVTFFGTPCQTASIRGFFPRKPSNLLLVELICHGVPSMKMLRDYIEGNGINPKDVDRMSFRTPAGFQFIAGKITSSGDKALFKSRPLNESPYNDKYYSPFFYGFSYRDSCYKCRFARPERVADITIGDFWGLGKFGNTDEIPPHPDGISVVLPNSQTGEDILYEAETYLNLYERPIEEAIQGNAQLRHPSRYSWRNKLYKMMIPVLGNFTAFRLAVFDKIVKTNIKRIIFKR